MDPEVDYHVHKDHNSYADSQQNANSVTLSICNLSTRG